MVGRDARRERVGVRVTDATPVGVAASGTGGVWRVVGKDGTTYEATLRGRLKKTGNEVKRAVGDHVRLERDTPDHGWAIGEIFPRTSRLARRAPGGQGERVIAANVD